MMTSITVSIYKHDNYYAHKITAICTNFQSYLDRILQMKFAENWHMGFRGKVV